MPRISYRRKLLLKKILRILLIILAVAIVFLIALIIYLEPYVTYDRNGAHLNLDESLSGLQSQDTRSERPKVEDAQIIYRDAVADTEPISKQTGYYITSEMLREPDDVLRTVRTMERPCAIMLELKSIFGNFYYSTAIDGAQTADVDIDVIDTLISYLNEQGFYMIAEIPAFCDTAFALANQSSGLPLSNGALWMDERGCYWLDPANDTVTSYLMQIARELSSLGFHEVVFSEFRFPASNSISYHSDLSTSQLIGNAAEKLTDFFANSNLMISFLTYDTQFPASSCSGRLYIPDVDGSKIEKFVQAYADATTVTELVFLADSRDTRFEEQAVLRPLLIQ